MTGGLGNDTFDLTGSDATIDTITDWGVGADVLTGTFGSGGQLNVSIDNSSTTAFSAAIAAASNGKVSVTGGTGNDNITGGAGSDTLLGGDGDDALNAGGTGSDSLIGGNGNDTFTLAASTGLSFNDTIDGGAGSDTVALTSDAAITSNNFDNVSNIETITVQNNTTNIAITTQNALVSSGATLALDASATLTGILTFDGSAENDGKFSITGGTGADVITGGQLADTLTGGGGNDLMSGGSGNVNDTLDGGGNNDILDLSGATSGITFTLTNSSTSTTTTVSGNTVSGIGSDSYVNMEGVKGTSSADTITGSSLADTLIGGNGADKLTGGLGADSIILTETTSAIDTVTLASGTSTSIDSVTGFTANKDIVAISLAAQTGANIRAGNANAVSTSSTVTVEHLGSGNQTIASSTNVVILDTTYANVATVKTAIESGGSNRLSESTAFTAGQDFVLVWYDGTNSHLCLVDDAATNTSSATRLGSGDATITELVTLLGVQASALTNADFSFIA
jgi:Ca2+-binding RTX toxin-like protein